MPIPTALDQLGEKLRSISNYQIINKITLSKPLKNENGLQNIFARPVLLRNQLHLSFTYRYPTRDITKNYPATEGISRILELLRGDFAQADVFTEQAAYHLIQLSDGRRKFKEILQKNPKLPASVSHDREKQRRIPAEGQKYLNVLGITDSSGQVKKEMNHKYRQINRYIEIMEGILKEAEWQQAPRITDMGSGKGYLTFALYDFLQRNGTRAQITGVELRADMVQFCNKLAMENQFHQLQFEEGAIHQYPLKPTDMLIALHACDTATDDAIFYGIQSGARFIICAPCCHKQVRRLMQPLEPIRQITRHGILLERQAELLTDTVRGLLLELSGYRTRIFDFIETEHTPKNILIVAEKVQTTGNKQEKLNQLHALKQLFGITEQHLEMRLKAEGLLE